jgi:hypothetical protein
MLPSWNEGKEKKKTVSAMKRQTDSLVLAEVFDELLASLDQFAARLWVAQDACDGCAHCEWNNCYENLLPWFSIHA